MHRKRITVSSPLLTFSGCWDLPIIARDVSGTREKYSMRWVAASDTVEFDFLQVRQNVSNRLNNLTDTPDLKPEREDNPFLSAD